MSGAASKPGLSQLYSRCKNRFQENNLYPYMSLIPVKVLLSAS